MIEESKINKTAAKSNMEQHNISSESLFISDVRAIIEQGRRQAYASVNAIAIDTYWKIGERIVMQEQQGFERAGYGKELLKTLSAELTHEYGGGFSERYLAYFRKFYLTVPNLTILQTRLQNWYEKDYTRPCVHILHTCFQTCETLVAQLSKRLGDLIDILATCEFLAQIGIKTMNCTIKQRIEI